MEGAGFANAAPQLGRAQGYPNTIAAPVVPVTLQSAISGFEGVNARLIEIITKAHQIAVAVGGPFPASGQIAKDQPAPESAVSRLNDLSGRCHRQLDDLNECLGAMARSLGA